MARARTSESSESSGSSDDDDEEEELAREFEEFCLLDKRAAVAAGRAAKLERFDKKMDAQYKEAGERMEEEMEIRARLREFGVRMENLPFGWKTVVRGKGKAQEKRARFMDQRVEEQLLRREEHFEAERVAKACFPMAAGCHEEELAKMLTKEAKAKEEEDERENKVRKLNGARRAEFQNDVSSDSDEEGPNPFDNGGGSDSDDDDDDCGVDGEPDCRPGILDGEEDRPEEGEANVMDGDLGSDDDDEDGADAAVGDQKN